MNASVLDASSPIRAHLIVVPLCTYTRCIGFLLLERSAHVVPVDYDGPQLAAAVVEFLERIPAGKSNKDFIAELEEVIETNSNRLMRDAGFEI